VKIDRNAEIAGITVGFVALPPGNGLCDFVWHDTRQASTAS